MKKTFECSKCEGTGTIEAFKGYANGTCFACGGTGLTNSKPAPKKEEVSREIIKKEFETKLNWLMTATPERISKLPFEKIHNIFHFTATCLTIGGLDKNKKNAVVRAYNTTRQIIESLI